MSPLALPRALLDQTVDRIACDLPTGPLKDVILQLKNRPTFAQQWPDTYQQGLAQGKRRVLQLESIRTAPTSMAQILSTDPEIYQWWNQIGN
jgi:hypothetical protein